MDISFVSETGGRDINEDSMAVVENNGCVCLIVADGLGGHGKGELASATVVQEMANVFMKSNDPVNCVEEAFVSSQNRLLEEQKLKAAKFEMKTTAVMLVIGSDGTASWGHIGDSRLYMFKKSRIKLRTIDHSVPQMLVLAKDIKEKEIRFHPDRNKLLKVMGVDWDSRAPFEVVSSVKLKKNTSFLICTDGFWELIDEKTMSRFYKESSDAEEWLKKMKATVLENGTDKNMDNFTAIAVKAVNL